MTHDAIENSKTIALPLPPSSLQDDVELAVYARFMQHLRCVPTSRLAIKVLSSIQFTADMEGYSDAHVGKILVEQGLRAPRLAFPAEFLEYADQSLVRSNWDVGGPSEDLRDLQEHWTRHGEDRFVAFNRDYPLLAEPTSAAV